MAKTWFWTKRVGEERTANLERLAAFHGGLRVTQEREQGLFGNSFPVARGTHAARPVVVQFGTNGFHGAREATETHTVVCLPELRDLPRGLRVFPSVRGGFTAKGGRRGEAATWMAWGPRTQELQTWLDGNGYVSLSERLGLRVHIEGVDHEASRLVAWLDGVVDLADRLAV